MGSFRHGTYTYIHFYSRSRVKVLWKREACSNYNVLNLVRWDAVPLDIPNPRLIPPKALSLFTTPIPTPLSNPMTRKAISYTECAPKVLKFSDSGICSGWGGGGQGRGVMGTHNFGILFYIMMMMILFFFLTWEFCEACVRCASLRMTHFTFGFPNAKIIKFGAFLPLWWSLQNNRVHKKKLGVCESE